MDNSEGTNISFYLNDLCQTVRMACAVNIFIYNGYHFPFLLYKFLNNWILLKGKAHTIYQPYKGNLIYSATEKVCKEMDPGWNRH